jgi:hypothetical protein
VGRSAPAACRPLATSDKTQAKIGPSFDLVAHPGGHVAIAPIRVTVWNGGVAGKLGQETRQLIAPLDEVETTEKRRGLHGTGGLRI